ncbi:MAG: hypothetical protein Q9218_001926 [Villophora microphyllina]
MHAPFHPLRSPPARESSTTSSKMSISGEPPPSMGQLPMMPMEQTPRLDPLAQFAPQAEDDHAVLQRIQSAIPDLHLLLTRYRDTSSQLGEREVTLRQTQAQKAEVLKERETRIEDLTRDAHETKRRHREDSNKHAEEKTKLRLELSNLGEQKKELEDHLQAEKTSRGLSDKAVQDLRVELAVFTLRFEEEKAALSRENEAQMNRFRREHEAKEEEFRMKEQDYISRLERQMHDAKVILEAKIAELTQQHGSEMDSQERAWTRQKAEWEETRRNLQREANDAKDSHHKSLSEQRERHTQAKEAWARERDGLLKDLENERASAGRGSEELRAQHQEEKDDMQRLLKSTEARLNQERVETETRMQNEIDRLKAGWDADKTRSTKAAEELKKSSAKLRTENEKLQRLAEAFEQVTDLRGREDAYYFEAFDCLTKQISDLAQEFCSICPLRLSSEITRSIPPNLPPFLTDTPASSLIRVAYVQSLVADVINRRIFQHFLFTFDDLDSVFNEWAEYLYSKSTKREAIWRQRTLHAAFSCPSSKPRINKFATSIIDEILYVIKPFSDGNQKEQMLAAVKKIVKKAAETWRYARIELSRISALPAVTPNMDQEGEVLMTMFPCIKRDPLPDDLRPDVKDDAGCVYTAGQVLTRNSPTVLARRVELGETVTVPLDTPSDRSASAENTSREGGSSDLGSQERTYLPRTTSPLIPPARSSRTNQRGFVTPPHTSAQEVPSQQQEPSTAWLAEARRRNDERGLRNATERREEGERTHIAAAVQKPARDHSAGQSPIQSPAHSRVGTPQLSRRTTATTSASFTKEEEEDEEEDTESTPKPGKVPDWREAGGNIPGAWG